MPNYNIQKKAFISLGKIGDISVVPYLIKSLKFNSWEVKNNSAQVLGKIGDSSAVPALIEALNDTDTYFLRYVAEALGKIAIKQPYLQLRGAIPVLKRLKRDRSDKANWPVYTEALEAIERATAGLKDIPIADTAPVPTVQNLPIPVKEPTNTDNTDTPPARKGLVQKIFRRS
jgi:HEAT repeat protein